jgi:hypothetical protein
VCDKIRLKWRGIGSCTSPLGEVGAKRRVRGYGLSLGQRPLTRFAAQIDLSPLGRGDPAPLATDSTIIHRALMPIERS